MCPRLIRTKWKATTDGLGAAEIAKRLNIGRASVYRVLAS
ncbi:MAG: helix-turn-helix domain-containing protein [Xanthobacteraceae bacterium]